MWQSHEAVRFFLAILRKVALRVQVGNPARKAPALEAQPSENEKIYSLPGADDINIWRLNNVVCSGLYNGAVINRNNEVYSRFIGYPWGKDLHPSLSSPVLGRRIAVLNEAIFLLTLAAKSNYYHWIADLLPRILLAKKSNSVKFNERHFLLHHPARQYETETLKLLKIKQEKVIRLKSLDVVNVNDLIVPDFLPSYNGSSFPVWKKLLIDEFKNDVIRDTSIISSNVYLLRGKQRSRNLIGEERLVVLLKERGFSIIDPQQMSLTDQIKALTEAKMVVALHGAAMTNILFCKENTHIIELRSTHKPPEFFSEIAKTCKLTFESISIPPERVNKKEHIANKQNLVMTEQSINILLTRLALNTSLSAVV